MKPLIGISAVPVVQERDTGSYIRYAARSEYVQRVADAGGCPLILPPEADIETLSGLLDGWLIPGGDDIDPSLWGEELHPEASLEDKARTSMEIGLYKAVSPTLPVLGICYGCQLINVLHGGSLHQHLPDVLGGDYHRGDSWQMYKIDSGTLLAEAIQSTHAEGKSYHHQAINMLGSGLKVTAHHEDGTIEAIEGTDRPWLVGVQWHPERSDHEATPKLFAAFIEQAKRYKAEKKS